jgi:proton-translocating NADH-quinone oxidoreductase chain M
MNFYLLLNIIFVVWIISLFIFNISGYRGELLVRQFSLFFSGLQFLIVLFVWAFSNFVISNPFKLNYQLDLWYNDFNFYFGSSVDNLSLLFLLLTFVLVPVCVLISWNSIIFRYTDFILCLIFISWILLQIFCIRDLLFFYILFEFLLIPMFILIGVWGSRKRKIHAVYQFFFYTLFSSIFMLVGILILYSNVQSTNIFILSTIELSYNRQLILWFLFFLAFAVKIPLFPFHIWLPEAHVEAPTVGSVVLAGILLKLGAYGILRFILPLFVQATYALTPFVYSLCVFGIIYTCSSTIRQIDMKKVIAYASISHMGFVTLGLFSSTVEGVVGCVFLMIAHGVVSSGLFFLVGCLYDRYGSRLIMYYTGLNLVMPLFGIAFFLLILSNISFPGTSSFIGEFLILLAVFESNHFVAFFAVISIVWTAVYSIWLYNRIMFGKFATNLIFYSDLSKRESLIAVLFCFLSLYLGLFTDFLIPPVVLEIFVYLV